SPRKIWMSVPQSPTAATRTRSSCGLSLGTGISRIAIFEGASNTAACIRSVSLSLRIQISEIQASLGLQPFKDLHGGFDAGLQICRRNRSYLVAQAMLGQV